MTSFTRPGLSWFLLLRSLDEIEIAVSSFDVLKAPGTLEFYTVVILEPSMREFSPRKRWHITA